MHVMISTYFLLVHHPMLAMHVQTDAHLIYLDVHPHKPKEEEEKEEGLLH